ncbi:MAG: hypothetical protein ABIP94_06835, partial [Planctomycetota bacterium]
MRSTAFVLLFAATLAAQDVKNVKNVKDGKDVQDVHVELAPVIAVEEQERDLAKAETMYRELLSGSTLSAQGRAFANLRLGTLLQKLGKLEEAKVLLAEAAKSIWIVEIGDRGSVQAVSVQGQDVEREKALREKARELVRQVMETRQFFSESLFRIDKSLSDQLLWIGAPAVPEVIACLEAAETARPYPVSLQALAGFLWYVGGPQAGDFLRGAASSDRLSGLVAAAAFNVRDPATLDVAATYLRHANWKVTEQLLAPQNQLSRRFDPKLIVDEAEQGGPEWKAYVMEWARRDMGRAVTNNIYAQVDPAILTRLHRIARQCLASADPELGNAAQLFLLSAPSQGSVEGVALLLDELPKMRGNNLSPQYRDWQPATSPFDVDDARRLLPKLDACVKALSSEQRRAMSNWFTMMMFWVGFPPDASVVPTVLGWIDLDFDVWGLLKERVTKDNAREVFARFDKIKEQQFQQQYVQDLFNVPLPQDLFPVMRDKAQQLLAKGRQASLSWFAGPMVR